jgi:hypothetical protein
LTRGAPPASIRWVIPRDAWFVNRAKTQPGPEFFDEVFGNYADQRDDLANATSATDLAHRHEASGAWLRLDPAIEPTMFHAAAMSEGELVELRTIRDQVRLGRVCVITGASIRFERGELPVAPDSLYIDCTASALLPLPLPLKPVFDGDRITIQMLRFTLIPFSAAMIALLEATFPGVAEKDEICHSGSSTKYGGGLPARLKNRFGKSAAHRAQSRVARLDEPFAPGRLCRARGADRRKRQQKARDPQPRAREQQSGLREPDETASIVRSAADRTEPKSIV